MVCVTAINSPHETHTPNLLLLFTARYSIEIEVRILNFKMAKFEDIEVALQLIKDT